MAKGLNKECGLEKRPYNSRKLCKPRSLQLAYLAAQADSQCFHSLPPKIQQKLFSEQERLRFRQACQHFVFDAADPRVYPSAGDPQTYPPAHRMSSKLTATFSQASTLYVGPFDKSETMDDSLYNSFRWLDEDADLDLTLDGYLAHNANTVPKPSRRRSSFQKTLSLNAANLGRKSSVIRHRRLPSLTRTFHALPPSNTTSRTSTTGPPSRNDVPRSSTSSIGPAAQHYKDPDARLKLRAFLASPQKFDEAIQFGFPTLENKENRSPEQSPAEAEPELLDSRGTFLDDDDDKSASWDRDEPQTPCDCRLSNDNKGSPEKPTLCSSQRPSISQECPGSREMTLKMTLTRPDLRTESSTPSPVENKRRDADAPAGDGGRTQELELDDQGTVRKMWRRLWKQKG